MQEIRELESNPSEDYVARPMDDNMFEWHFTIRGPEDSDFAGGIYHGKIHLPNDYPFKPPDILLLTPNGRFEINKKICLSMSGYHPENWQPCWSLRTVLVAMRAFMPTPGAGAIGALDYPPPARRRLAKQSLGWTCLECNCKNSETLSPKTQGDHVVTETQTTQEAGGNPQVVEEVSPRSSIDEAQANAEDPVQNITETQTPQRQTVPMATSEKQWILLTMAIIMGIIAILIKKALRLVL